MESVNKWSHFIYLFSSVSRSYKSWIHFLNLKYFFFFFASLICYAFRIYEDAEVNLTRLFTTNSPDQEITNSKQGDPLQNLLDLQPSQAVFYVGGYPIDFAVSVSTVWNQGRACCMERFPFF